MKKIYIKVVLLISIMVLLLSYLLDPLFSETGINSETFKTFNSNKSDSLDILFIGSSHSKSTYKPSIFDSIFNIHPSNFFFLPYT